MCTVHSIRPVGRMGVRPCVPDAKVHDLAVKTTALSDFPCPCDLLDFEYLRDPTIVLKIMRLMVACTRYQFIECFTKVVESLQKR